MLAVTVVMSGFTELEHKTSMSDLNLIVLNVGRVSKEVGEGAPYKKYFCLQARRLFGFPYQEERTGASTETRDKKEASRKTKEGD